MHETCEDDLFNSNKDGWDAILQVTSGDLVVSIKVAMALENAEDGGLHKIREYDQLQRRQLEERSMRTVLRDRFESAVEVQDCDDYSDEGALAEYQHPKMCEAWLQARLTIGPGCLTGLLYDYDNHVDDQEAEDADPSGLEPMQAAPWDYIVALVLAETAALRFSILQQREVLCPARWIGGDVLDEEKED